MDELAALPEEARKLALERFRLLQPHLEQGRPLRAVAVDACIPLRTAQRWVMGYRRFGLAALARKGRGDAGKRRVVSRKLKEIIEGLALQKPPLPLAALYRQVQRIAKERGEKAPSYGTVFNIVRNLGRGDSHSQRKTQRGVTSSCAGVEMRAATSQSISSATSSRAAGAPIRAERQSPRARTWIRSHTEASSTVSLVCWQHSKWCEP